MPLTVIASERFAEHQTPPGHPECSERADVMDVVAGEWQRGGGELIAPPAATREQLARVHEAAYLDRIAATAGRALVLDPDTYTSADTAEIAGLAAGAAVEAVDQVMGGRATRALALVRPPGHHAERGRAMGFCLYNNVAVGASHARAIGAARVAIVDYDVHHGNGTQHIFETSRDVLYISTHQFPYYPGTGAVEEIGRGPGEGFTVNVPLVAGAVDADYQLVFADLVVPILHEFKPDLLLVSAGFDAHERDPLGGMRLTARGYGAMTSELRRVAAECCGGRIAMVTEGGYDALALAESLRAVVSAMSDDSAAAPDWPASQFVSPSRGRAAVAAAKAALAGHWNALS
jgi:acetoin utilization deacetylase AcuC-like enzyme